MATDTREQAPRDKAVQQLKKRGWPASGAAGNRAAGAAPRRISADGYAVIDAGSRLDLTLLARLFGEVPADQYDPGYASAGAADWYVPARNSYSYGEPQRSGELLIVFGTQ